METLITFFYKRFLVFIWLGFISLLLPVNGQSLHNVKQHIFNQIDIHNQNWSISQNPNNRIMYFANSEGLVEYNGISSNCYSLPYGKGVRSVCVNDSGIVFTGSFEEIGYWKPSPNGVLVYNSLSALTRIQKND
jgi:hypothetical protein